MIYTNDWDINVDGSVGKIADDSNIGGVADNEKGCQITQRDRTEMGGEKAGKA